MDFTLSEDDQDLVDLIDRIGSRTSRISGRSPRSIRAFSWRGKIFAELSHRAHHFPSIISVPARTHIKVANSGASRYLNLSWRLATPGIAHTPGAERRPRILPVPKYDPQDIALMEQALTEARQGAAEGEVPVGALIALDGLSRTYTTVRSP
jgi:hypothetical protein